METNNDNGERPLHHDNKTDDYDNGYEPRLSSRRIKHGLCTRDATSSTSARSQFSVAKPKFSVPSFKGKYDPNTYCD